LGPETPWAKYDGKHRRGSSFVQNEGLAASHLLITDDGVVIRSQAFLLEDENGNIRASLGMAQVIDGVRPRLSLYNEKGYTVAEIAETKEGAELVLSDANGHPRASLEAGPVPWLKLMNEDFYPHASLMVFRNNPRLTLCDENKKEIWSAP
jgi:hypothetical protein